MRILITSFVFLFVSAEISQWLGNFTLPLPILILGGACLAIASNYGKSPGWYFPQQPPELETKRLQTPTINGVTPPANSSPLNSSSATPPPQPPRSISFTIRPKTHTKLESNRF
ncbi:hypothetical protein [Limnofasciculus baicalensis]|uniref:Uncharacterized protein n=1 Tax=Limnofasciculus baicalensis BBK-W-15 TaxID=2699891 RepID=A0AAE3H1P3_9CYAN|nr:hypothetical protein [Limnofasciculus baicalensis]MCP2732592.1 hypothetical protein [Limnofasciculus baicalensis BBK-W-15]